MSYENKVVLITGAASGIGEALAVRFAKSSAKLALWDINAESLKMVIENCENLSKSKPIKIVIDVTKDEDVKQGVKKTVEHFGKLDVVVNCAGIASDIGILENDFIIHLDKVLKTNLRSYVVLTHYAAAALIASKGCIINIASAAGIMVEKNVIPYAASKAAVIHFTKNAALELADKGVRVNSISPGIVKTNIQINSRLNFTKEIKLKSPPLNHNVQAEEVAELASYLASDKAISITGADFVIDSGLVLLGSWKI